VPEPENKNLTDDFYSQSNVLIFKIYKI